MKPPNAGRAIEIVITRENGSKRRLSGDDAHRWLSAIDKILTWLEPVKTNAHVDNFSWEESVVLDGNNVVELKLDAVRRIVFLHGKENRDSAVYLEATEELARLGLEPG